MEFSQFTGLRNDRPIERFDPSDLSEANNVDIDNSGAIAMRSGYVVVATVAAGAKHSAWADPSGSLMFYVQGSSLYQVNPNLTSTVIRSGLTLDARMSYHFRDDRIYFTNGHESGIFENGAVRSWGLEVPKAFGATQTVGALTAGSYQYAVTYVRNDGQESGATLAKVIVVPSGAGLIFTLPVSSDPTVVSKNVYLSTPNGESQALYLCLNVPNSQTTASYQGNASELNLPLITQFLSAPPVGHMVGYYRGLMCVAVEDRLYPSEPFAYELFDLRKGFPFDGKITMFAPLDDEDKDGLFIGTDRTAGIMVGKGLKEFEYVKKTSYGVVEGSLTYVDGSLFGDDSAGARTLPMWLSYEGICVGLPNMAIRNLTRTRYSINTGKGQGASIFIPGPNRLIMVSNY